MIGSQKPMKRKKRIKQKIHKKPKIKTCRNYAFIDSQNVNLSVKDQGWVLDFAKFRKYLKDKYHIIKAFLLIGYVPQNQDLYKSLQNDGFILIFKPTHILPSGKVKGNVDAELVLHAMIEYNKYDKVLIVTGDGDFYCLVDFLCKKQKLLKLMIPNKKKFSSLFRKLMKDIVFISDLKKKLKYVKQNKKRGALPRDRTLWMAPHRDSISL